MKKLLMILLAAAVVFSFAACDDDTPAPKASSDVLLTFDSADDLKYFQDSFYGWSGDAGKGLTVSDGKMVVKSTDVFVNFWTNLGDKVAMEEGRTYSVTFDASVEEGSTLSFSPQLYDGGAEIGGSIEGYAVDLSTLTTTPTTVTVKFTYADGNFTDGTYQVGDAEPNALTTTADNITAETDPVYGQFVFFTSGTAYIDDFQYQEI